eukprot:gene2833-3432_t
MADKLKDAMVNGFKSMGGGGGTPKAALRAYVLPHHLDRPISYFIGPYSCRESRLRLFCLVEARAGIKTFDQWSPLHWQSAAFGLSASRITQ